MNYNCITVPDAINELAMGAPGWVPRAGSPRNKADLALP